MTSCTYIKAINKQNLKKHIVYECIHLLMAWEKILLLFECFKEPLFDCFFINWFYDWCFLYLQTTTRIDQLFSSIRTPSTARLYTILEMEYVPRYTLSQFEYVLLLYKELGNPLIRDLSHPPDKFQVIFSSAALFQIKKGRVKLYINANPW